MPKRTLKNIKDDQGPVERVAKKKKLSAKRVNPRLSLSENAPSTDKLTVDVLFPNVEECVDELMQEHFKDCATSKCRLPTYFTRDGVDYKCYARIVRNDDLGWLCDEAINAMLAEQAFADPKVEFFNTFTFQNENYKKRRWEKKKTIIDKDFVVVPINQGGAHWVLGYINVPERYVAIFDSLGTTSFSTSQQLKEFAELRLEMDSEKLHGSKSGEKATFDILKDVPQYIQQKNGSDCGVAVCITSALLVDKRTGPASKFGRDLARLFKKQSKVPRNIVAWSLFRQAELIKAGKVSSSSSSSSNSSSSSSSSSSSQK